MRGGYFPTKAHTRTCSGCGRDVIVGASEEYQVQVYCHDCQHKPVSELHYCMACNAAITLDPHGDCPKGHRVM